MAAEMRRKPGECGIHIRQEKSISGKEWSTVFTLLRSEMKTEKYQI